MMAQSTIAATHKTLITCNYVAITYMIIIHTNKLCKITHFAANAQLFGHL